MPIEQLEYKLLDLRKNSVCPSATLNHQVGDDSDFITEDFIPHFQRVNISGEDITGYSADELQSKSKLLHEAIELRRRYEDLSLELTLLKVCECSFHVRFSQFRSRSMYFSSPSPT